MSAEKVVLITGAFSGIGKAVTELMMQAGAKVVAVGRNEHNSIPSFRNHYLPIVRNIREFSDAEQVTELALERFRHIDIVIHAAGKGLIRRAQDTHPEDFERMMRDNYYTAVHMTQAILPHLLQRNQGQMIFFPGISCCPELSASAAYCAAKTALKAYVACLREDLKSTDIKISNLNLGKVNTDFWAHLECDEASGRKMPAGDAARAVWLALQTNQNSLLTELELN
jgi:NADP-dependent 3-hydroxy acid dehydrogenase YdfG